MTSRSLLSLALIIAGGCARATDPSTAPHPARTSANQLVPALRCDAPAAWKVRSALYFGLSRPHGPPVTNAEWMQFLDAEITPHFEGLTVIESEGRWRNADGSIAHEPSRVVIITHDENVGIRRTIEEIIRRYRTRFDQEAVLWETSIVCAKF